MPFTINPKTLSISGRKGDTATFIFEFDKNISSYTVHFQIKKNVNDSDDKAIISKKFENPSTNSITVNLSSADTKAFASQQNSYVQYVWGLKIYNGTSFAQTLIPKHNFNAPSVYIYPEVVGGE